MKNITEIPLRVRQLYEIVADLEGFAEGRHFTLDGHLVGSIGEILAKHYYGLDLASASTKGYDATAPDGRRVEIKTTQGAQVGLRSKPTHLLVLKILPDGSFEEIYNGPGNLVWKKCGKLQKNGQRPISVKKLRALMAQVELRSLLPRRRT